MSINQTVTDAVKANCDYRLRKAQIASLRLLLDELDKDAENIKLIDLPLWYVEPRRTYARHKGWHSNGGFILVRDDVDVEVINWLKGCCRQDLRRDFYREWIKGVSGLTIDDTCSYTAIFIGNEITPAKRYYLGMIDYDPVGVRDKLQLRLGEGFKERPRDIGNLLSRYVWAPNPEER